MSETTATIQDESWIPTDTFGARLALVRQRNGWNVKQAAEACGLHPASWTNWERGKACRNVHDVANAISKATGVSYEWLMIGGELARSRCFSLVPPVCGQLELDFQARPELTLVASNI